jgi:hypothetical protein
MRAESTSKFSIKRVYHLRYTGNKGNNWYAEQVGSGHIFNRSKFIYYSYGYLWLSVYTQTKIGNV